MTDIWRITLKNRETLLDRSRCGEGIISHLNEEGEWEETHFDALAKQGNRLLFYKFRSDSHKDAYNTLQNSKKIKFNLCLSDYCLPVFECALLK